MNHLSPAELVDLAEGVLDPSRAAHAARCQPCTIAAQTLRSTLQDAKAAPDLPEPSPLFWTHLSSRIGDAVNAERHSAATIHTSAAWFRRLAPIAASGALIAVVAMGIVSRRPASVPRVDRTVTAPAAIEPEKDADVADMSTSAVWDVLSAAADDLEWEDAHAAGMVVQPGAVDSAVQRLSAAELTELGRLLQTELKRSGD
jgi:hypothetical protein